MTMPTVVSAVVRSRALVEKRYARIAKKIPSGRINHIPMKPTIPPYANAARIELCGTNR